MHYQNPDKFQFKFSVILCLRQRLLLASKSLMLLVNNHILKMAAMLKSSAEYNRRPAIIEGLRAGRSATKIIRFFGYLNSTIYDIVTKYIALEQSNEDSSMPARKRVTRKNASRGLPQLLKAFKRWFRMTRAIVARSDGCSEAVDGNCGIRKAICFSARRCTSSYESFDSKLALEQHRYVLIQGILASQ